MSFRKRKFEQTDSLPFGVELPHKYKFGTMSGVSRKLETNYRQSSNSLPAPNPEDTRLPQGTVLPEGTLLSADAIEQKYIINLDIQALQAQFFFEFRKNNPFSCEEMKLSKIEKMLEEDYLFCGQSREPKLSDPQISQRKKAKIESQMQAIFTQRQELKNTLEEAKAIAAKKVAQLSFEAKKALIEKHKAALKNEAAERQNIIDQRMTELKSKYDKKHAAEIKFLKEREERERLREKRLKTGSENDGEMTPRSTRGMTPSPSFETERRYDTRRNPKQRFNLLDLALDSGSDSESEQDKAPTPTPRSRRPQKGSSSSKTAPLPRSRKSQQKPKTSPAPMDVEEEKDKEVKMQYPKDEYGFSTGPAPINLWPEGPIGYRKRKARERHARKALIGSESGSDLKSPLSSQLGSRARISQQLQISATSATSAPLASVPSAAPANGQTSQQNTYPYPFYAADWYSAYVYRDLYYPSLRQTESSSQVQLPPPALSVPTNSGATLSPSATRTDDDMALKMPIEGEAEEVPVKQISPVGAR